MEIKSFNGRFIPRGDIEAGWNKAIGFIPLDKEIIIYKKDDTHSVPRIKIGDGVTVVQELPFVSEMEEGVTEEWVAEQIAAIPKQVQANYAQKDNMAVDYIKNRPFYDDSVEIFTWDGDLTNQEVYADTIVRLSDQLFTLDQLQKCSYDTVKNGVVTTTIGGFTDKGGYYSTHYLIYVYDPDMCKEETDLLLPPGFYTPVPDLVDGLYVSRLYMPSIKQLDEKYVPDTIARVDYVDKAIADINIPEQSQADYAQNDVNASDYIKNRPFYEEATGKQHTYIPTGANMREGGYAYQLLTTEPIEWPEDTKINYEYWSWGPVNGDKSNIQYQFISSHSVLWKDSPGLLIWRVFDQYSPYTTGWYTQAAKITTESGEQVTSVTVDSFKGTIKQLDEKFIPDSVARISDLIANIEHGSKTGSIQQVSDGVANGFDFTGKNPNAEALDNTLSAIQPYGAQGDFAVALGGKSSAQGKRSTTEGTTTIAKGKYSHAEGDNSVALSPDSHVEGYQNVTSAPKDVDNPELYIAQHAEGIRTQALGWAAHSEGSDTIAKGSNSHAGGSHTIAEWNDQTVVGRYNYNKYGNLFEVGNGTNENNRSNAFEVKEDGTAYAGGKRLLTEGEASGGVSEEVVKNLIEEVILGGKW